MKLALVEVVDRTLTSFVECGTALATIRDERLYRDEHATFESFVLARWGITARRARQLMASAEVVASLPSGTAVPLTERHARELMPLRDRPELMAEAIGIAEALTDGRVTGDAIAEAVRYIEHRLRLIYGNGNQAVGIFSAGLTSWAPDVDAAEWHHIVAVQMAAEVRYNEQTLLPEPPWWSPGLCMADDTWAALVRSASPKWNGKIHELCEILPMMPDDQLEAMAESIAKHGLFSEGTLLPDGTMLDGKNRQRACLMAGVPMRWKTYDGDDGFRFWYSVNLVRRNLSEDQRLTGGQR